MKMNNTEKTDKTLEQILDDIMAIGMTQALDIADELLVQFPIGPTDEER